MGESKGEVKLLGSWSSPFVMRARILLGLNSVDYEFIPQMMQPKSELLLKLNPVHKKIPVLVHNDRPICESRVIVEYIDEVWSSSGSSILPSDPYDSAIQRFWAAYIDDKWFPGLQGSILAPGEEAQEAALDQVKEGLPLIAEAFEQCSKGKPFFGGDKIEFLDIVFGSFLGWVKVTEKMKNVILLDQAKFPSLVAWADRFCAHDAVKDLMPETDKLVEFAQVLLARIKANATS